MEISGFEPETFSMQTKHHTPRPYPHFISMLQYIKIYQCIIINYWMTNYLSYYPI